MTRVCKSSTTASRQCWADDDLTCGSETHGSLCRRTSLVATIASTPGCRSRRTRRVQKYKRTLIRPARRAVVEFIYHHYGERHHQGLGNAFVFLVTTGSFAYGVKESVSVATYSPSWAHSAVRSIPDVVARRRRGCAPQKVDPALIARFRPAMLGCFVPVLCQNSALLK